MTKAREIAELGQKLTVDASGNIDVAGTGTFDGLTVDGDAVFSNGDTSILSGDDFAKIQLKSIDGSTNSTGVMSEIADVALANFDGASNNHELVIRTNNGLAATGTLTDRISIASNGDISFYEDTGTTPKFVWKSADERLGIGTDSPNTALHVSTASTTKSVVETTGAVSDALIEFTRGQGTGNTWSIGLDQSNSSALSFAYLSNGSPSLTSHGVMTINSSGNVGIGTSSPSSQLEVSSSGDTSLTINAANNSDSKLVFSEAGSAEYSIIMDGLSGSTQSLQFYNNRTSTEAMRITSDGSLLVGTTDSSVYNNGSNTSADTGINLTTTYAGFSRYNGTPVYINRTGIDGDIVTFNKSGASVGSIGTEGGRLQIGKGASGLYFYDSGPSLLPWNVSTNAVGNGTVDLGSSGGRFKDLYLSGGIEIEKGSGNVGVGKQALNSNTASNNTAVGYQAGYSNNTGEITSVGYQAGFANTTGLRNTSLGDRALRSTTSGADNTASGMTALYSNTTGNYNTALGSNALFYNTTASYNTAVGYQAGYSQTTAGGGYNTYLGYHAGYSGNGYQNAFVGYRAGYNATSNNNTFMGVGSGSAVTTGAANTILGRYNGNQGGLDIRISDNYIVLSDGDGNPRAFVNELGALKVSGNAGASDISSITSQQHEFVNELGAADYTLRIKNSDGSGSGYPLSVFYGNSFNDTNSRFITCHDTTATRFLVYSNGNVQNQNNSYGAISDQKLKQQITEASSQWDDIKALQVRKYKMNADVEEYGDSDDLWRLGVVAQEVEAAGMSGLVTESSDATPESPDATTVTKSIKYSILYMKAVKALQEAMDRIETLEAKVTALENP